MKGVLVEEWTTFDKLKVKDLEEPALSDNQVKIKVKATGISFAMSLFVQGSIKFARHCPSSLAQRLRVKLLSWGLLPLGLRKAIEFAQ